MVKFLEMQILTRLVLIASLSVRLNHELWRLSYSSLLSTYIKQSNISEIDLQTVLPSCKSCISFVNLFSNIDLIPTFTPIIIRRLVPFLKIFGSIEFVPFYLALNTKKFGSPMATTNTNSQFCMSKYFDIKKTVCTQILTSNFSSQIRPWNFDQYIYLLPQLHKYELNGVWKHANEYGDAYIPSNFLVIAVSAMQSETLLSWADCFRKMWTSYKILDDNIVVLAINVKSFGEQNRTFLLVSLGQISANIIDITIAPLYVSFLSLPKVIDSTLARTPNISEWSVNARSIIQFNYLKECKDLRLHKGIIRQDIDHLLMCVKSHMIWKDILGKNFELLNKYQNPSTKLEMFSGFDAKLMSYFISHP